MLSMPTIWAISNCMERWDNRLHVSDRTRQNGYGEVGIVAITTQDIRKNAGHYKKCELNHNWSSSVDKPPVFNGAIVGW